MGPGRLLVTTGRYPRVVTSGEECRAVKKFGKDELGEKKKRICKASATMPYRVARAAVYNVARTGDANEGALFSRSSGG